MRPFPVDDSAPCTHGDPDRFFPELGSQRHELEPVLAECTGAGQQSPCPFLAPCRDYALRHGVAGIWGGTTVKDRQRIRHRLGIVAVPVYLHARTAKEAS